MERTQAETLVQRAHRIERQKLKDEQERHKAVVESTISQLQLDREQVQHRQRVDLDKELHRRTKDFRFQPTPTLLALEVKERRLRQAGQEEEAEQLASEAKSARRHAELQQRDEHSRMLLPVRMRTSLGEQHKEHAVQFTGRAHAMRRRAEAERERQSAALDRRYERVLKSVREGAAGSMDRARVAARRVVADSALAKLNGAGEAGQAQLSSAVRGSAYSVAMAAETDGAVAQLLGEYILRVVSREWLLRRPKGWKLQRQQDLPLEAFLPPAEAKRHFEAGDRSIAALSYLSPLTARTLATVCSFLASERGSSVKGVFWDYMSLSQKPRSQWEEDNYRQGVNAMAKLYASPGGTIVLLQRRAVGGEVAVPPFELRGWCVFEHAAASLIVGLAASLGETPLLYTSRDDGLAAGLPKMIDISGGGNGAEVPIAPPLSVEVFGSDLERSTFAVKDDHTMVLQLYAELRRVVDGAFGQLRRQRAAEERRRQPQQQQRGARSRIES